jgi:histidine triad (HIT) family protein
MNVTDCIFCRIIARAEPAQILYENEDAIGILDIHPIHLGHSLVIPKRHCAEFVQLSPDSFHGVMTALSEVSRGLVSGLKLEGFNIFSNNGTLAGQSVFHFHFHITPRYRDDNIKFVLKLKHYSDGELATYADRIRASIKSQADPNKEQFRQ